MIDYLDICANGGIILNPGKFQFCCKEVEFAGFFLSVDEVRPLRKYLDAIRDFPRPQRIGDIRAWFGLVNQVAHYSKLVDIMAPFKALLSPKTSFLWDEQLNTAFEESKLALVDAIKLGVKIFDPNLRTCLTPDWSKIGIGYLVETDALSV